MSLIQSTTSQSRTKPSDSNVLSKSIPVQMTEMSTFDDSFSFLKERFAAEMKRMDEEMNKFSSDLIKLYGQTSSAAPAVMTWDTLAESPLIQGDGENKSLKLQFDLSQFDPNEINVKFENDVLVVTAVHSEKNDTTSVMREFRREFLLPKGTDANSVKSFLSREGVLSVQAPLPQLKPELDKTFLAVQEEEPSKIIIEPAVASKDTAKPAAKESKETSKKNEPSAFEQKRTMEHKKAQDQKTAHDQKTVQEKVQEKKTAHEQKALEIAKEKAAHKPLSSQSADDQSPQRGASRVSKSSKK